MSYGKRIGKKPFEYASKSSHSAIINDSGVKAFLQECNLPPTQDDIDISQDLKFKFESIKFNPIKHIIAIDGGYTEIQVKEEFPSSTIAFFQIGALFFEINDLQDLKEKPFIDPNDIAKLKNIERLKLPLPTKNINFSCEKSLTNSLRKKLYSFFISEPEKDKLRFIETLRWLLFEEYSNIQKTINLATCPSCGSSNINLNREEMNRDFIFKCPSCYGDIYLTDIFRFHEAIDDELGAGGILGYLVVLIEQIYLIHSIKIILSVKPSLLNEILFIKDGPLAFFGQTAGMYKYTRTLMSYLFDNFNIFLVGLEKSGPFVEHADNIAGKLGNNEVLVLNNEYIYKYILPCKADSNNPYGRTTYYGNKIIFKTGDGKIYVATLPTKEPIMNPKQKDFKNIDIILANLELLKCDMYDSALIPIALVNRLVSLSNHPSSVILERFAKNEIF